MVLGEMQTIYMAQYHIQAQGQNHLRFYTGKMSRNFDAFTPDQRYANFPELGFSTSLKNPIILGLDSFSKVQQTQIELLIPNTEKTTTPIPMHYDFYQYTRQNGLSAPLR